jgi:hypothetical protein
VTSIPHEACAPQITAIAAREFHMKVNMFLFLLLLYVAIYLIFMDSSAPATQAERLRRSLMVDNEAANP